MPAGLAALGAIARLLPTRNTGSALAPNRDCDSPARKSGASLPDPGLDRLVADDDYAAAASGRQGFFNRTKLADGLAKTDPESWVDQARIMIDGVGVRVYVWKTTETPIVHAGVFGGFTVRANATACGLDSGADREQSVDMPESGLVCQRCFPELWPGARPRAS